MMGDMNNPFKPGDWILWEAHHIARRGEVLRSVGPSVVVRWLGGEEQVFPLVEPYLSSRLIGERMTVIERPKEASRIARDERRGVISITRASAILGVTPKRVRSMLREGKLRGVRKDGKWISVELDA